MIKRIMEDEDEEHTENWEIDQTKRIESPIIPKFSLLPVIYAKLIKSTKIC